MKKTFKNRAKLEKYIAKRTNNWVDYVQQKIDEIGCAFFNDEKTKYEYAGFGIWNVYEA